LIRCERLAAGCRRMYRTFASGMRELNAELCHTISTTEIYDTLQRGFVVVVVQTKTAVRDAADGRDMRRLGDQKAGRTHRELAQMHEMPVVRRAVLGVVLAHRRDHDAIGKREAAKLQRGEECARHSVGENGLVDR